MSDKEFRFKFQTTEELYRFYKRNDFLGEVENKRQIIDFIEDHFIHSTPCCSCQTCYSVIVPNAASVEEAKEIVQKSYSEKN